MAISFKLCFSFFSTAYHLQKSLNPTKKKLMDPNKFFSKSPNFLSSKRLSGYSPSQASNSPREEESESSTMNESYGLYLEDVNYLWKLGIGSAAGAAAIKYGSILFPEITKPNLLQALIMISAPVVVAVVLLLKRGQE